MDELHGFNVAFSKLPKFFLVNKYIDDQGNYGSITSICANHTTCVHRDIAGTGEGPHYIYAWADHEDADVQDLLWTDAEYDKLEPISLRRLQADGYKPATYINYARDGSSKEYQLYGKMQPYASLDRGCTYIQYVDSLDKPSLCLRPHIFTIHDWYAMSDDIEDNREDRVHEYIIGLSHLYGRIKDTDTPIRDDAVLIIPGRDPHMVTHRSDVIMAAVEFGYDSSQLAVLIDLMAKGAVVFDNTRHDYEVKNVASRHGWYAYPGPVILTDGEFYELCAYGLTLRNGLCIADSLHSKCRVARNLMAMKAQDPMEMYRDFNLVH